MKYALIIGNNQYNDQKLARLKSPAADAQALANVLSDQNIGSFDKVVSLVNRTESHVSRGISNFLTNKRPDPLPMQIEWSPRRLERPVQSRFLQRWPP